TGTLGTFNRILNVPVGCQVQSAPRTPGDPVQDFDTEMVFLQGELFGDPDFCTFRVTGGTGFGLPSPGHTTLTQLPSGNWNVDSFFDVTYRIEFVGCPGSILDGLSGTTVAGLRMETGGGGQVPSCDGICPPGTRCVEQRTFNADGSVDLCCNCVPIICNITAVRSCKIHTDITGQSRRLCIDLGDQGTAPDGTPFTKNVEPRLGQTDDVEIDLTSVAGFGGGVTVSCTDNAGNVTDETGRVSGVTVTGNTVNIKFAPALPDETACVITLDCGAQTCIRTLRGDVDRNGRVTTGDASQVRFWFNQCPPFPVPPEFDVDQLNCVTTGDFSQIRFFFNNVAPACP
ncbi:MAG: hypothetical protein ACE5GE_07965, partial [Phycisphaerae bacterium]